ncbi:Exodeoxyribonuclease V gamma chain [Serratia fonticola]|uniref:Exodeoxyribonuclease V gamma chain n=1 Tax=Serratia fonticola TaxID=47917 RepID=A0A4U9VAT3_SERFO|nr:Exodeoxyribonuclease V gamma chain [Serratia fonticola]
MSSVMPFFASKEPHVYGLSFQSVGLAENADQRADSQRTFGRSVSTGSGAGAKPGMAQWLQMQLAEQFGIAANIVFPLPATFIWDMFTKVLPGIPKESAFSKDAMTWKLMWLLPGMLTRPEFAPLQHYLTDDADKRKIHQLAGRVADLFDQYLVYRPQWLESWQRGEAVEGLAEAQKLAGPPVASAGGIYPRAGSA